MNLLRCLYVGFALATAGLARVAFAQALAQAVEAMPATATAPAARTASALRPPLAWTSSGILVAPHEDDGRDIVSIKDPSVVRFNDRWHVFATTANKRGHWQMVYLSFAGWSEAATARQVHMDQNPNLRGYHCAPHVFYFRPHRKWYLVFQSQHPQYSTSDDIADPMSWSKPEDFFDHKPPIIGDLWLDYWIICDDAHAYLFFTGDNGRLYRSRTTIAQFPRGMSDPVAVLNEENRFHLFEGSATYRIKGEDRYLTIVEALGPKGGTRYYRSFVSDRLDGEWTPLADTWDQPFAGMKNVRFANGVEPWTEDISHGELIRDGYDETMTIDSNHLQFLYQGRRPSAERVDYSQLLYRLDLLTLTSAGRGSGK
jgi:hypothetical protein